ncbi:hypothetical protein GCM10023189_29840 [Nibrella saemangeumensis]|uniref:Uncharacterized protein n=1 Tax=Nibrella saemangeumensis TaxID=1084526 RepID=A0ABP8N2G9_9BACT
MRQFFVLISNSDQRRWLLQLLALLLGVALLAGSIWLYYDYQVRQLEQQQRKLITE